MSNLSYRASAGAPELSDLLVLLHGADTAYRSVQADYRVWRHEGRLQEAHRADIEERKRHGVGVATFGKRRAAIDPPERELTVRIWREGDRARDEHHGGPRDGYYGVRNGAVWWIWDKQIGAISNQDNPGTDSGVGRELGVMLNPVPLLGELRFAVAGSSEVAGRAAITVRATPRPTDSRHDLPLQHDELGSGADRYVLEVDGERGVLLAATAFYDDEPFQRLTAFAIAFDQPIPDGTFRFTPPAGEEIKPTPRRRDLRKMTLVEAQNRASFTVLMPDRVPAGWQEHCTFVGATDRPRSADRVLLTYNSDDGHESVSITQMSVADRSERQHHTADDDDRWQTVTRNGVSVTVRPSDWGQAQAHIERHGTFVYLRSDNLTNDQLATIAAGLRPAPTVGSI